MASDAAIESQPIPATWDGETSFVPLRARGDGVPVFFLHPPSGLPWLYRGLFGAVPAERPMLGAWAADLDLQCPSLLSVSEMAEKYAADIRRIQPHGPYTLAGYSFGGYLAFETAARLLNAGEEIRNLLLFDVSAPKTRGVLTRVRVRSWLRRLRRHALRLGRAGDWLLANCGAPTALDRAMLVFRTTDTVADSDMRALIVSLAALRKHRRALQNATPEALADAFVEELRAVMPLLQWQRLWGSASTGGAAAFVRALTVWGKNDVLATHYATVKVLPIKITVFAARDNARARAWQRHTTESIDFREVAARPVDGGSAHLAFLHPANIALFGEQLRAILDGRDGRQE